MRCLTLADELTRHGHECRFICREHQGHLGHLIVDKGYGIALLPAPGGTGRRAANTGSENYAQWLAVPWEDDARQTIDALVSWEPDWLVVDHYALDADWERTLASAVRKVMVIDDLANRAHACDLLLDQNLGGHASNYDDLVVDDCQRLVGPPYALLRPEFAENRKQSLKRRKHPALNRILVSLGGIDQTNVTGQVLDVLEKSELPPTTQLDIIMGANAPYLNEVRQQASKMPFKATVSVNAQDMAERMCMADLSIGAAGGTSWERCCLGLPSILVILAENQADGAKALEVAGAATVIGHPEQIGAMLPKALERFSDISISKRMSKAAADVTDGCGVTRAIAAMTGPTEGY